MTFNINGHLLIMNEEWKMENIFSDRMEGDRWGGPKIKCEQQMNGIIRKIQKISVEEENRANLWHNCPFGWKARESS